MTQASAKTPPKQLYELDPSGVLRLNFHPGQMQAWNSTKRFIFVIAGSQGGKTSYGPFWLAREIEMMGAGDYLAVTSSYDLFKLKLLPEIRNAFEHVLKIGRYWVGERVIEIKDPVQDKYWARRADDPMWGRIILRSAAAKGGLESSTAKAAWLDECGQQEFTLDSWEAVRRRLSLHSGRVLGTTTPYDISGWLRHEIVDRWRAGDPEIDVIRFASIMNPTFPFSEYLEVKRKMARWRFNMMYRGMFSRPAGMIYGDFRDRLVEDGGHLVNAFPIPAHWPVHVAVDPGKANLAKLWLATDPATGKIYVFREESGEVMSTSEHAAQTIYISLQNGELISKWFIGSRGETQQRLDWVSDLSKYILDNNLDNAGWIADVPEPLITDVESGIDKVIEGFRLNKLYIFSHLNGLLRQIRDYRRELDSSNEPTMKIKDKEKYHYVDALRYGAANLIKSQEQIMIRRGEIRKW